MFHQTVDHGMGRGCYVIGGCAIIYEAEDTQATYEETYVLKNWRLRPTACEGQET